MCGIAGIVNFDQSKINPELANGIKKSLEHRGPDFSKVDYINENVALIHTRLSIIDLDQRSNQPMYSKDNRFSIVFNGEIYNFREIRKTLEKKVFVFLQMETQKCYLKDLSIMEVKS